MKSKDSNVVAREALAHLLKNGFNIAADVTDRRPKPTQRRDTRETRSEVGIQNALTSASGKSVFVEGEHAQTGQPVRVHMLVKGRLSTSALHALQQKTGHTFG